MRLLVLRWGEGFVVVVVSEGFVVCGDIVRERYVMEGVRFYGRCMSKPRAAV